ncbi:hypothetical protein BH24GEM2_BH24GEM2_08520 [soil metagenome]|jgi:hypothetical protein
MLAESQPIERQNQLSPSNQEHTMKATRMLLAALAISLVSAACSATDITSPESAKPLYGQHGSGQG